MKTNIRSTTIIGVRHKRKVAMAGDGQVTFGEMAFKQKADLFYRMKRLLDYNEMGNLFKVIFAQKKDGKFSLGF